MYSPKIREDLIPIIYRRAKLEDKPMTAVVNEILEGYLIKRCRNCNAEIMVFKEDTTAYCEYCETEVFLREK